MKARFILNFIVNTFNMVIFCFSEINTNQLGLTFKGPSSPNWSDFTAIEYKPENPFWKYNNINTRKNALFGGDHINMRK